MTKEKPLSEKRPKVKVPSEKLYDELYGDNHSLPLEQDKKEGFTPLKQDNHRHSEGTVNSTVKEDAHVKKYTKKYSKRNGIHQVGLKEDKQ